MKALQRKKKKQMELEQNKKKSIDSSKNNEIPKKKLISIPSDNTINIKSKENSDEINNMNIIQNIHASRPANNVDVEKISQRKRERRMRKNKNKNNDIEPVFVDNNTNNNNTNNNINNDNVINDNINNKNTNTNIINNEKENNNNLYDSESVAPVSGIQNNNINPIQSGGIMNINHKIISVSSSSHSVNNNINNNNINNNINEIQSSISTPNYKFLSKNYNEIKAENVKEFLTNTNAEKPYKEQKEQEINKMIKLMELKPKSLDIKKDKEEEQNFTNNLIQNIEEDEDYKENQKKIKELKIKVKEEESKIKQMLESNKEEIKGYIENIIKLQNDLINSQQGDVFSLEEENKIDDIQIQNLSSTYQRLIEDNEKEKQRISYLINGEISELAKELNKEINEVRKIKKQLEIIGKNKPPRDIMKKIEVIMRYKKKNNII